MASLKQMAVCIGLTDGFSVVRDFYGYITGAPQRLSLLKQIGLLKGKHLDINLIRVGIESFDNNDEADIDGAVQRMRDIYATVSLGVGRVTRWFITTEDANGQDNIDNDGEAEDLTDDWTVDNNALDVFCVLTYAGDTAGLSAVKGDCDKDGKGMTGSVIEMQTSPSILGLIIAHEVGHYLGLDHSSNSTNLMFKSVPNEGQLTSGQGSTMRGHCFVRRGC